MEGDSFLIFFRYPSPARGRERGDLNLIFTENLKSYRILKGNDFSIPVSLNNLLRKSHHYSDVITHLQYQYFILKLKYISVKGILSLFLIILLSNS